MLACFAVALVPTCFPSLPPTPTCFSPRSQQLFYQRALGLFANMHSFQLDPAPSVTELLQLALEEEEAAGGAVAAEIADPQAREQLVQEAAALLASKGEMLAQYFGIGISAQGQEGGGAGSAGGSGSATAPSKASASSSSSSSSAGSSPAQPGPWLTSLPRLVDGHTPCMDWLPSFLLDLALQAEWEEEGPCFRTVSEAVGRFYARLPDIPDWARPVPRGLLGGRAGAAAGGDGEATEGR